MSDSFAFALNLLEYTEQLPLELAPGIFLDQSNPQQSKGIRAFLDSYGQSFVGGPWIYFVEPVKEPPTGAFSYTQIPPEQAKFWVVNFTGSPGPLWSLCDASQLTDSELEVGVTFHPNRTDAIHQVHPPRIFHFSQANLHGIARPVTAADLLNAERYRKLAQDCKDSENEAKAAVFRIFQDFVSLSKGPRMGHLVLLGHFALIEALITHDPHKFGDSLNHQLSTKMPLLMKRFERPLDSSEYFELSEQRKIWKQLYEIRSLIAHGGRRQSKTSPFGKIRSNDAVFRYVRDSLKRLLVHALQEPDLIYDLKAC